MISKRDKATRCMKLQHTIGTTADSPDAATLSQCRIFRYRLPLAAPLRLAGQVIHERAGILVRIDSDSGVSGWGDAAPLPGFSRETVEKTEAELTAWAARLRGTAFDPRGDDLESRLGVGPADAVSPSVRFALETALASLSRRLEGGAAGGAGVFRGCRSRERVAGRFPRAGARGCPAAPGRGLPRGQAQGGKPAGGWTTWISRARSAP